MGFDFQCAANYRNRSIAIPIYLLIETEINQGKLMMAVAESTPELLLARSLTVYVPGAEKSLLMILLLEDELVPSPKVQL